LRQWDSYPSDNPAINYTYMASTPMGGAALMLIKLPNAPIHLVASSADDRPARTRTVVRLSPELNALVRARAEAEGLSKMDWIFRAIRQQLAS
jgi:hypothetical protein